MLICDMAKKCIGSNGGSGALTSLDKFSIIHTTSYNID